VGLNFEIGWAPPASGLPVAFLFQGMGISSKIAVECGFGVEGRGDI